MPKNIKEVKNSSVKTEAEAKPAKVEVETGQPNENEKSAGVASAVVKSASQVRVDSKSAQMKVNLESQPKVSIMIPLERGEARGATQPFCLNGYHFNVPKGMMTTVPQQVAEMIADRFNVELDVRSRSLENRGVEAKEALNIS